MNKTEKLQKVLANAGLGSRREIEQWIAAGRVKVAGQIAKLGDRILTTAEVSVDGRAVKLTHAQHKKRRVLIYYKPEGELCSRKDEEGRTTVFENLPSLRNERWIMVGRLDLNSMGLLLFTNDGELANRLMHPSYEIEREYAVRVLGSITEDMQERLLKGVRLEDGMAHFEAIQAAGGEGANHWYHVKLREGRNREIRRLLESQDLQVSRLIRIRYGAVSLPRGLRTGQHVELDISQVNKLLQSVDLSPEKSRAAAIKSSSGQPSNQRRMPKQRNGRQFANTKKDNDHGRH